MACYAQINVSLADEGGYVARWEEDAVVSCKFFLSKYVVCLDGRWGKWENPHARALVG